jgi:hypothetical protein
VREPDSLLNTGDAVETHTHTHHHNTHLVQGLWQVHRFDPVMTTNGEQSRDTEGELLWHALPVLTIKGGGPRSIVPIPANMRHRFVVLEGPAFYRCCFVHRDKDGNPSEIYHGYESAYR